MNETDEFTVISKELISFLDSKQWRTLTQSIDEKERKIKEKIIDKFLEKIRNGSLTIESIFYTNSCKYLTDAFISNPNLHFFTLCLNSMQKNNFSLPFVENSIIYCHEFITEHYSELCFINNNEMLGRFSKILIFLMNSNKSPGIFKLAQKIKLETFLKTLFNSIDNDDEFIMNNISQFQSFFSQLAENHTFWTILHQMIDSNYPKSFQFLKQVFGKNDTFLSLFDNFQISSSTISSTKFASNQKSSSSTKIFSLQQLIHEYKETQAIPKLFFHLFKIDKKTFDYLIISIKSHANSNNSSFSCDCRKLLDELQYKKMINDIYYNTLHLPDNNEIEQIINLIDRSKVGCEQFSWRLFQYFNRLYYEQTQQTIKNFVFLFNKIYLQQLQFSTLDSLALSAISFLKSDLSDQHRRSLTALALRLPINRYITDIFLDENNYNSHSSKILEMFLKVEIQTLEMLHLAAIQTSSLIKTSANSYKRSIRSQKGSSLKLASQQNSSSLNNACLGNSYGKSEIEDHENENLSKNYVFLDKRLVLRLRWRSLRNDSQSFYSFLPEFLELCESDKKLFLKWEASCYNPETDNQRFQILTKLGLVSLDSISLVSELLAIENPTENFVKSYIQIFTSLYESTSKSLDLKLPEKINLKLLFRFNFLWCKSVMHHPQVCEALRNPTNEISQALFNSLASSKRHFSKTDKINRIDDSFYDSNFENNDFVTDEDIFMRFPLGFSALLANSKSLDYKKEIPQLNNAEKLVLLQIIPPRNSPKYVILSVCFESSKKKTLKQLSLKAASSNLDQQDLENWLFYCFFFSICSSDFDLSIELLSKFDFLFNYLKKNISEEIVFFGNGKWIESLTKFSTKCEINGITFPDNKLWQDFISLVHRTSEILEPLHFNHHNHHNHKTELIM
ncbi:hypothetical protein TRFO_23802 [Tritrichomonas foetus]|uniref:Uncharacterized protein n=1 Tax=Tritrichomonas foetus TaxID=1144522 RepID=A0A1J4KDZ9_9EUKA|nr:hypothetical protein TRFO_23802 [Tritrichomonas foetus]|eukprot:OHT07854.1 hypothetical protein TRFO_23802 [Tritrichomonas foetus]